MKEAMFYKKEGRDVRCGLCPHECRISEGKTGICKVRVNEGGILYSGSYGETVSLSMDPVEKKPLFHLMPGKEILSVGPNSCNLRCIWCQNWQISQNSVMTNSLTSRQLLARAKKHGSVGVAYTYTEPFMMYEYIYDTAPLFKKEGLKTVLVTNGYVNSEPLEKLLPYIDAMNIDLKTFNDNTYKKYTGGRLQPVLDTIEKAVKQCLVEVTTLLIPNINDDMKEIEEQVKWIAKVSPDIPLHFSRYCPQYKCDEPVTPERTLMDAYETAIKHLRYVYLGNIRVEGKENTYCPGCEALVISRTGYRAGMVNLDPDGKCSKCGFKLNFIIS